jgi:hypothetical protein
LLYIAGIKSKKRPTLNIIIERDGFTEDLKIESFNEFIKLLPLADGFIITVEDPEVRLRESFKAERMEIKYKRENKDWICRVNFEGQEITKDLLGKIKEVVKERSDMLVDAGIVLVKILQILVEIFPS